MAFPTTKSQLATGNIKPVVKLLAVFCWWCFEPAGGGGGGKVWGGGRILFTSLCFHKFYKITNTAEYNYERAGGGVPGGGAGGGGCRGGLTRYTQTYYFPFFFFSFFFFFSLWCICLVDFFY